MSYKSGKKPLISRDSTISNMLGRVITGKSITKFMGCLSPSPWNGGETAYTVKFAKDFANLREMARPNKPFSLEKKLK